MTDTSAFGPRAQRTIARIKDATCQVFLTRGYSGTTIDEIASLAGVSRASFYTYFTSKREVLVSVGDASAVASRATIDSLATVEPTVDGVQRWVADYFVVLDEHGPFAFAWTQAAQQDEEIRLVGMRAHLQLCRRLGEGLGVLVGATPADPRTLGLAVASILDRSWNYATLYAGTVDRGALEQQVAVMIWNTIKPQIPPT